MNINDIYNTIQVAVLCIRPNNMEHQGEESQDGFDVPTCAGRTNCDTDGSSSISIIEEPVASVADSAASVECPATADSASESSSRRSSSSFVMVEAPQNSDYIHNWLDSTAFISPSDDHSSLSHPDETNSTEADHNSAMSNSDPADSARSSLEIIEGISDDSELAEEHRNADDCDNGLVNENRVCLNETHSDNYVDETSDEEDLHEEHAILTKDFFAALYKKVTDWYNEAEKMLPCPSLCNWMLMLILVTIVLTLVDTITKKDCLSPLPHVSATSDIRPNQQDRVSQKDRKWLEAVLDDGVQTGAENSILDSESLSLSAKRTVREIQNLVLDAAGISLIELVSGREERDDDDRLVGAREIRWLAKRLWSGGWEEGDGVESVVKTLKKMVSTLKERIGGGSGGTVDKGDTGNMTDKNVIDIDTDKQYKTGGGKQKGYDWHSTHGDIDTSAKYKKHHNSQHIKVPKKNEGLTEEQIQHNKHEVLPEKYSKHSKHDRYYNSVRRDKHHSGENKHNKPVDFDEWNPEKHRKPNIRDLKSLDYKLKSDAAFGKERPNIDKRGWKNVKAKPMQSDDEQSQGKVFDAKTRTWQEKRSLARAEQRSAERSSDWMWDRARGRKDIREEKQSGEEATEWMWDRAKARKAVRLENHSTEKSFEHSKGKKDTNSKKKKTSWPSDQDSVKSEEVKDLPVGPDYEEEEFGPDDCDTWWMKQMPLFAYQKQFQPRIFEELRSRSNKSNKKSSKRSNNDWLYNYWNTGQWLDKLQKEIEKLRRHILSRAYFV